MELKYAQIDSLSQEDMNDLFNYICSKIILQKPSDVKRDLLGIEGSPADIKLYIPEFNDIAKLILIFDIGFTMKISHVDAEVNMDAKYVELVTHQKEIMAARLNNNGDQKICETHKMLKNQVKDIKNPDLTESNKFKGEVIKKEVSKEVKIKASDIPPTPDFI